MPYNLIKTCRDRQSNQVEIWRVDLQSSSAGADIWLSVEERVRAGRYMFDRDRRRFTAGRSALRSILARHLGCDPDAVELRASQHGRPSCPALTGHFDFNLSNSEDIAIIAVSPESPVGVDVECLRPVPDCIDLSRRYFSATETESLINLDAYSRNKAFLTCWTRKEAVLKAIGLGLYLDPATIDTGIGETEVKVSTVYGSFAIMTFFIGDNAVAALATPQPVQQLKVQTFGRAIREQEGP